MGRRGGLATIICLAALAGAPTAGAAVIPPAGTATAFHPKVGARLGLLPVFTRSGHSAHVDVATGQSVPVVYHGGSVMAGGVTVHTIFWAPPGHAFQGSPGGGVPTYEGLTQQLFTDLAHDSGAGGGCTAAGCNIFSVLPQYAEGTSPGAITPGAYQISYSAAADSVDVADPYPAKSDQCASPAGTATCITDGQVQAEIDHVISTTPGAGRNLNNLWFVFLPPGVDECISAKVCGTNAFAAYHSALNLNGHGLTVYGLMIDPIIEAPIGPGADPQGYPDAEAMLNAAAHETVEAMTDPVGTGWMDPNGFETGDKCESGPQIGQPLGFAGNGSPYNQVINGHQYLIQQMWANSDSAGNPGCVQSTSSTNSGLPLPQVNLRQYNPTVSGNVNLSPGGGIGVKVSLVRTSPTGGPVAVASGSATTAANGSWSVSLGSHAPGDDRDEVDVDYSGAGAPKPSHQVVLTGNGGNPVAEAGWTGWMWMDAGSALSTKGGASTLTLAPCGQTGVLSFTFNGVPGSQTPTEFCSNQTDGGTVSTPPAGAKDVVTASSNDNRAFASPSSATPNLAGGLVNLTVPVGEPNSVSQFSNPLAPGFTPTGVPNCTADLELGGVVCAGLVSNSSYTVIDGRRRTSGTADSTGSLVVLMPVHRGDFVSLSNGARSLTTLHVAHLRVDISGERAVLAGGHCEPGDYFGTPLTSITPGTSAGSPTSASTGGVALTGLVCPESGDPFGLPNADLTQTDDRSGGQTTTEVPHVLDTSPIDGETVYGTFRALAESGLVLPGNTVIPTDSSTRISLRIATAARGTVVFSARNVDTARGVAVPALKPGNYIGVWLLTDANGDRRLVTTRIISQTGRTGPGPRTNVGCRHAGGQIHCNVTFPGNRQLKGKVNLRLTRGGTVVALGHASVKRGRASLGMRVLRNLSSGAWQATIVLSRAHLVPVTIRRGLRTVR